MNITDTDKIKQLWEACCCPVEFYPEQPQQDYESLDGSVRVQYATSRQIPPDPANHLYARYEQAYSDGGSSATWVTNPYTADFWGKRITDSELKSTSTPPFTGTITKSYLEEIFENDVISNGLADLTAAMAWDDDDYVYFAQINPYLRHVAWGGLDIRYVRYRMTLPTSYDKSWFKTEWDEVSWDYDNLANPSHTNPELVTHRTWEWTGGNPHSPWYEFPAPALGKTTTIENIAAATWRSSRFGYKLTRFGDWVEFD